MAKKKKSWLNFFKKLFMTDASSRLEKKDKRRRWMFGRFQSKRLASLSAPSPLQKRLQNKAQEETHKLPCAAAETPQSNTATSTTKDPRLQSGSPPSSTECKKESQEISTMNVLKNVPQPHQQNLHIKLVAAIKIQLAFRGFLARKALRALKGLVKLQAIIRGWAVRRQAMHTLKCLQTIINIQSEFCAKRCDMVKATLQETEKDIKKRWGDSVLSKEEANALSMNKKVASIRRERIKEYWLNHRRSTESEQSKLNVKQRYWLEQWVDSQLAKREDLCNLRAFNSDNVRTKEEASCRPLRLQNLQKHYQIAALNSPTNIPRRSFHRQRQLSIGEDVSCIDSQAAPTYMAATESAKAKARSLSSPRLRPIQLDAYSEISSPYKHKLSTISSINSEATSCSQISKHIAFSQRSPCMKGTSGPVKSIRSVNNDQLNAYG